MKPSILLLGSGGQLGWELQRTLPTLGRVTALDYPHIDFSDFKSLEALVAQIHPTLVVNAAAYTEVDRAESEPHKAAAINAGAPGVLVEACRKAGAALVHYSTDYVFDGAGNTPYVESDPPHPLGVYGQTKLDGERAVLQTGGACWVFRTAWVYSLRKGGFVNKVLQWSHSQSVLRLVTDQVSNPTWCRSLAEITAQVLACGRRDLPAWVSQTAGLYHLAGSGHASRLEWARLALELDPQREEQTVKELLPALTADFPAPAQRPLFSALDCTHFVDTFGLELPDWQQSMRLMMA